jgi:chromosomal replication initiation ATPase DnaA
MEDILKAVSSYYDLDCKEILMRSNVKKYGLMRQIVMSLAWINCGKTLKEIGNQLGGIKQPTVSYAIRKLGERMRDDKALRDDIRMISKELKHLGCSVTIRLEHN